MRTVRERSWDIAMENAVQTSLFFRRQHNAMTAWEGASRLYADADSVALVAARILRVDVDGVRGAHLEAAEKHGVAAGASPERG